MKNRQEDVSTVKEMSENILANSSRFRHEIANLKEILETSEEVKRRFKEIMNQLSER